MSQEQVQPVKSMSLTARFKDFYGYREGQGALDFMKEVKALTQEDKVWFANEFNKAGLPTDQPATLAN